MPVYPTIDQRVEFSFLSRFIDILLSLKRRKIITSLRYRYVQKRYYQLPGEIINNGALSAAVSMSIEQ